MHTIPTKYMYPIIFSEHMHTAAEVYGTLNKLVAPTLPVKYPRTPGYKPEPSDNKLNAW